MRKLTTLFCAIALLANVNSSSFAKEEETINACPKILNLANGSQTVVTNHIIAANKTYSTLVGFMLRNHVSTTHFINLQLNTGKTAVINYGDNKKLRDEDFELVNNIIYCLHS